MKNMTPKEQNDMARELDADHLPVHKDVVAALLDWHLFWSEQDGPQGRRANTLWREINTNPLPKPPEPPLHEQVLAELGETWEVGGSLCGARPFFYIRKRLTSWLGDDNPNTPAQIANALRVLAGEAV